MLTSKIFLKNFNLKKKNIKVKKNLNSVIKKQNPILKSLGKNYVNSYTKKTIKKYSQNSNFRVIGMGGSSLGAQAIYEFLKRKIKKEFVFVDNLIKIKKKITKKNLQI